MSSVVMLYLILMLILCFRVQLDAMAWMAFPVTTVLRARRVIRERTDSPV